MRPNTIWEIRQKAYFEGKKVSFCVCVKPDMITKTEQNLMTQCGGLCPNFEVLTITTKIKIKV